MHLISSPGAAFYGRWERFSLSASAESAEPMGLPAFVAGPGRGASFHHLFVPIPRKHRVDGGLLRCTLNLQCSKSPLAAMALSAILFIRL